MAAAARESAAWVLHREANLTARRSCGDQGDRLAGASKAGVYSSRAARKSILTARFTVRCLCIFALFIFQSSVCFHRAVQQMATDTLFATLRLRLAPADGPFSCTGYERERTKSVAAMSPPLLTMISSRSLHPAGALGVRLGQGGQFISFSDRRRGQNTLKFSDLFLVEAAGLAGPQIGCCLQHTVGDTLVAIRVGKHHKSFELLLLPQRQPPEGSILCVSWHGGMIPTILLHPLMPLIDDSQVSRDAGDQ